MSRIGIVEKFDVNGEDVADSDEENEGVEGPTTNVESKESKCAKGISPSGFYKTKGSSLLRKNSQNSSENNVHSKTENVKKDKKMKKKGNQTTVVKKSPQQKRLLLVSPKLRVICKEKFMTRQDAVSEMSKNELKVNCVINYVGIDTFM